MLFILFVIIGIIAGCGVILLTRKFREIYKAKLVVLAPSIVTLLVSIYLMYVGNVVVTGFDGAAYMLLSIILFCFGAVVMYLTDKRWSSD